MKIIYKPSFVRDVKKCTQDVKIALVSVIENIKSAKTLIDISNVKKLKGHKTRIELKLAPIGYAFIMETMRN